jgi:hypothetical protein
MPSKTTTPESLERALVFEAPWLFSGVYSIVRPWLDEVTAAKVKFVTKATLKDDVPIEFLPPDFGGESDFIYSYVPIAQRPLHAPTARPGMVTLDDERWSSSWSSFEESALETAESDTDESAEGSEKAEEHGLRAAADNLVWAEVTAPIRVLYEEDKLFQALRVMESIERELAARFEGPLQAVVLQRLRDQAVCSVLRRECEQARKTLAEIDVNNGWVEMQRTKNIVTHYKHEEGPTLSLNSSPGTHSQLLHQHRRVDQRGRPLSELDPADFEGLREAGPQSLQEVCAPAL